MFLTIIKAIAEISCLVGSEVIVGSIVKTAATPSKNKVLRACSEVATFCVAGVLGSAASKYADETIDEVAATVEKLKGKAGEENGAN